MIINNKAKLFLLTLFWIPVIYFSGLLSYNSFLYFTEGPEYGILPEKMNVLDSPIWKACFYTHLPAGILCLFTPLIALGALLLKSGKKVHTVIGNIYVWATLGIVCPTGMYLAIYAKGGFLSQSGFMLQGIVLFIFTYVGYIAIIDGKKEKHRDYMIRSYALISAVLTFRILHILFVLWKVPYHDNYAISQWLSMVGNVWIGEIIIYLKNYRQNKSQHLNKVQYEI